MIVGHLTQRKDIFKILKSKKLNKSFIFSGKDGIGKKLIALEMSKFILDESTPDNETIIFSKISDQAQMINKQVHPDLILVNPKGDDISIEEYTNSIENIYKKPLISHWKVMLVNDAEKMNKNIFNAMLKLFEEPPHNTTIILITSNLQAIPATLLSRCIKINFSPLENDEITKISHHNNIPPELSNFALNFANGSIKTYNQIIDLDIYSLYLEFLKIFSASNRQSAFLKLYDSYNLKENWPILKTLLIKILKLFIEKNIPNQSLLKEETDFLNKTCPQDINYEELKKIIFILNYVSPFQLDPKIVGLFYIDTLCPNNQA